MLPTINEQIIDEAKSHVNWYHDRYINPYGPNHWTTVRVDQASLLSVILKLGVKSLLEIGTWEGFTTMCMWTHGALDKCRTMDVCAEYEVGGSEYHNPDNLKGYGRFFRGVTPVDFRPTDSRAYKPEDGEKWDMVFIDGNHNAQFVAADWAMALRLATKVIAFHDYDNGNPGVDEVLSEIAKTHRLHWFEGSAVVYVEVGKSA